jgi:hypothetical protein
MKKIVMIVFAGLLVSAGLHAQKVCIENGKVILDLREAAGMPTDVVTNVSKTARFKELMNPVLGVGAPLEEVLWHIDNQESSSVKGEINATVFEKLEVAPKDMNKAGVIGGTAPMTMDWPTAFNGCINSTYDNGGWRLPTQRELQMIWIFNDALTIALPAVSGAALLSVGYRSATEFTASSAWYVDFGIGNTNHLNDKTFPYLVRCVREVTTP